MFYQVNEIFVSLQGEGLNLGKVVSFIRFSGCNQKCPWCDTDHAAHSWMSLKEIMTIIKEHETDGVIITGGEPTIQNLTPLLIELKRREHWVGIETNGTNDLSGIVHYSDYIAFSPKGGSILHPSICLAQEIRIVNAGLVPQEVLYFDQFGIPNKYISVLEQDGEYNLAETVKLIGQVNERTESDKWRINQQLHKLLCWK